MSNPLLLIRADASLSIGFGHVLRSLALAQAWQDAGGEALFVCASLPEVLRERLEAEGCHVQHLDVEFGSLDDAAQTRKTAQEQGAAWVVCDGYHFDGAYLRTLKSEEFSLLTLDDFSLGDLSATDGILNPNAGARPELYVNTAPKGQVLTGSEYALLRREFRLTSRREKLVAEPVERVLITMGGADVGNLVPRALSWLQSQKFRGHVVVLSGGRQFDLPSTDFELEIIRAQNDVPQWMNWCDLALATAGAATWELACCGVPTILSVVADNQRALARWCDENGVASSIGEPDEKWEARLQQAWQTLGSPVVRHQMSSRGRKAIDGQGASRVVRALWPDGLQWRSATLEDALVLWQWRNEPHTRAMSLLSEVIPWDNHLSWLSIQLRDENSALWMVEKDDIPVGNIRFARAGDEAMISIVVAPDWRGRGLSSSLIAIACRALFAIWNVHVIRALIKPQNAASRRAFEKAGFCCKTKDSSMPHLEFVLERRT